MAFRVRGLEITGLVEAVAKARELAAKDGGEALDGSPVRPASVPIYDTEKKNYVALVTVDVHGSNLHKLKPFPKGVEIE